jgi:hypothetical protein
MPALYSNALYGSTTYGAPSTPGEMFGICVDWDRRGYYTGRNEAKYLESLTVSRGRRSYIKSNGEGFEQEDIGHIKALIADPDGDYNPFNTASPLYGNLSPNKRMEANVMHNGIKYPLITGNINNVIPLRGLPNKVRMEGVDGWPILRGQKASISMALQEMVYCDDVIPLILDAAGWPPEWGSVLDTGQDIQPYWWVDQKSAAEAIFDLAHSELGRIFIKNTGEFGFKNKFATDAPVATITDADYIYDSLDVTVPWETQRNIVTIYARPRTKLASQVIWNIPTATPLTANTEYIFWPDFKYGDASVPAKNVIAPVPTTDFDVNTLEDGTGTDLTSSLTVVMETFANKCKLTLTLAGVDGYLRTMSVRGEPIVNTSAVTMRASSILPNQDNLEFVLDTPWIQSVARATSYVDYLLSYFIQPKQYITLTLKPNSALQFGIDLGDTVRMASTLLGVNSYYGVSYIEHQHTRRDGYTLTTLKMEPLADTSSYWRMGISQLGISTVFAP